MTEMNATNDIAFIKSIIEKSKRKIEDNGFGAVVWAFLIAVGLVSTYIGVETRYYFPYMWNWIVIIGTGWLFSFFYYWRESKKSRGSSILDKIMGALWTGFGVSLTIIGFVGPYTGAYNGLLTCPIGAALLGSAFYTTGVITETSWFKWLSIGWWLGAIYMFVFLNLEVLLILAGMMVLFQMVPGIIIYFHYKHQKEVEL